MSTDPVAVDIISNQQTREMIMAKKIIVCSAMVFFFSVAVVFAGNIRVINNAAAFPEGPCWHKNKLFYTEYGAHTVKTWDGGTNQTFWQQDGCGPSAVVPVANDEMLVTCYDSGEIVRISSTGKTVKAYKKDKDGQTFMGPNDFAVDSKGGAYFTASGPWESEPIVGKIFYLNTDGVITEAANDLHYANGLAMCHDGKTLYCAESEAGRVIQFAVGENGNLSDRRLFVRVAAVDPTSGMSAYPDGLKVDSAGNLYIGQYSMGRIVVVTPDGKLLKTIEVPSTTAPNLTFNADESKIFVMAVDDVKNAPYMGKVYKVPNK
jgi:gluconolactonase